MLPRRSARRAGVRLRGAALAQLPQIKSWPHDGGAFITLPQVYTEDPDQPGPDARATSACTASSSSGNAYEPEREVGLHYQIHRGIGVHHAGGAARAASRCA